MASNPTDIEGLALSSNLPDTVPDLLQTVASHGKDLIAQDPEARLKLPEAARSLTYALETPREAIIRHCWSESTSYAALETAVDINLFSALGTDDKPKTVAELAEATSVDPILLGRLMKHLAAIGTISETGYNEYCPTGFSKVLTVERYSDAFPLI
ncbi:Demethylsterigmatocystin 6-O-methyltransferase [Penicillium chrysogenum]|uniref:Demethylsterigmatocystin 6-O-methyltransferase n=1 Tax=Penicillium chrysogenum TaxID=5076 RepID=A0A161Z555_PENCH|nr:Demethylsterigmatocystin 6-O-methyltransferase [Penicillium chrysogenum]